MNKLEKEKQGNITVDKLKDILKTEYGIHNQEEFDRAIENSKGLNIGIFTQPYKK